MKPSAASQQHLLPMGSVVLPHASPDSFSQHDTRHSLTPPPRHSTALGSAPVMDLQHAAVSDGPDSLAFWATHYLRERVVGNTPNTVAAKARDLRAFALWFVRATQTTSVRAWRPVDTRMYLVDLQGKGRAPKTVNRALGTLKHFARWVHDKHGVFGAAGLPTADVRELPEEEPPCKKLTPTQVRAVLGAAEAAVAAMDTARIQALAAGKPDPIRRLRPRRDFAMLAVLLYTGLRVQELVMLRREQFDGEALRQVARKGRGQTGRIYVPVEARRCLADYLDQERCLDDGKGDGAPLFLATRSGGYMDRRYVGQALDRIAEQASQSLPRPFNLHPHLLRHTFGAMHRAASGSDAQTRVALGHTSLNYVGRYTRQTDEERDALVERAMTI